MLSLKCIATRARLTVLIPLALMVFGACRQASTEPEQVVRDFLGHLGSGNARKAWNLLTDENQRELRTHHEKLAKAGGRTPSRDPAQILYGDIDLDVVTVPEKVHLTAREDRTAVVRVSVASGSAANFKLVKEKDGWRIDLLKTFMGQSPTAESGLPNEPRSPKAHDGRGKTSTSSVGIGGHEHAEGQ